MARFTVLVAEPDAAQRQIVEMLLLVQGGQVTMALNAREALTYLQNNTPELIVAATDLPQMNGFDLSRKARGVKRLRRVPVILTAPEGTVHSEMRGEAEKAGADLLMVKPLGDKNLGDRAAALIRQAAEQAADAGDTRRTQSRRSRQTPPPPDRPAAAEAPPDSHANVLNPVSEGVAVESEEIRKLRMVVADLSAENDSLRKQLTATGRETSGGLSTINDLRERLARADELLEEYRRRYPDVEGGKSQSNLGKLLRRKL